MKVVLGILAFLGLVSVTAVVLVYSGAYNVAASEPHSGIVAKVLGTIQVRSVRARSKQIEVPPLTDPSLMRDGMHHYQEMCVTCHGAPGVDPSEIGKGLNPPPPDLSKSVKEYRDGELYWIVKHGIKMTGMPSFSSTHTDEELWGIVAFLRRLPQLSPDEYRAMLRASEMQEGGHSHAHPGGAEVGKVQEGHSHSDVGGHEEHAGRTTTSGGGEPSHAAGDGMKKGPDGGHGHNGAMHDHAAGTGDQGRQKEHPEAAHGGREPGMQRSTQSSARGGETHTGHHPTEPAAGPEPAGDHEHHPGKPATGPEEGGDPAHRTDESAPGSQSPGGHEHHPGKPATSPEPGGDHARHPDATAPGSQSAGGHEGHEGDPMPGLYGPYPMTREASGTSWQPELAPMEGAHLMKGPWMLMLHGWFDAIYDYQSGPRGNDLFFGSNMFMAMARRPLGPGSLGFRGMFSLEPFTIGTEGYPLLLQTGETANGEPLVDRQHPHDLFMELSTSYALHLGTRGSLFAYFGLPGEPALGPPVFMHRFSGMSIPEAPIGHHWLDSTHITYGVATVGALWRGIKLEGSIFTGQEPDERRWDIEKPTFDSWSARLSLAPLPSLAFQMSFGHLIEPEALEPGVNLDRLTASAAYHRAWNGNDWQTTFAWGRNIKSPGATTNAFLLESTLRLRCVHTAFGRAERVDKDELFAGDEHDAHAGQVFTANKLSLGYRYDFLRCGQTQWGIGTLGTAYFLPEELEQAYGSRTPLAFMVFSRVQLGACQRK